MVTDHISYNRYEARTKQRVNELGRKLGKTKSSVYKTAVDELYKNVMLSEEKRNGRELIYC